MTRRRFGWLRTWIALAAATTAVARPSGAPADAAGPVVGPGVDPWAGVLEAELETKPLLRNGDADVPGPRGALSGSTAGRSWLRTLGSLAGVVCLIVLLAWGYRATSNGLGLPRSWRGNRPGILEVVSRTQISARQSVCLIRVGPRMVLVGVSGDQIQPLDVISDVDVTSQIIGEEATAQPGSHRRAFEAVLDAQENEYEPASEAPVERLDSLGALRTRLTQTLERLRGPRADQRKAG